MTWDQDLTVCDIGLGLTQCIKWLFWTNYPSTVKRIQERIPESKGVIGKTRNFRVKIRGQAWEGMGRTSPHGDTG